MIIKIEVSNNALKAYLRIVEDENVEKQVPASEEEIIEALKAKSITYGIQEEEVKKLAGKKTTTDDVVIAAGTPPTVGKQAEVQILKQPKKIDDLLPNSNEEGEMDYISPREGWIVPVNKGEEIAVKAPPTQGAPGRSIFDNVIPGVWGADFALDEFGGMNTEVDENTLVATSDGFVVLKSKKLNVEPTFRVYGDVGPSTGSIEIPPTYEVEIAISKDVKSGYWVRAHKVTIGGCIEESEVTAEELYVAQGIVGKSDIPVTAKTMVVGYINGSRKVYAVGLKVEREISSGAQIFAAQVKASNIQGSTVTASEYIWTNFLNGQNKVLVGIDYKAKIIVDRCTNELNRIEEPLEQLQKAWRNSEKKMAYLKELSKKNPKHPLIVKELPQIKEVKEKLDHYMQKKEKLEEEKEEQLKKMYPNENPFLLVRSGFAKDNSAGSIIEPNTIINIRQELIKILEASSGRLMALEKGKLINTGKYNMKELKTKMTKIEW